MPQEIIEQTDMHCDLVWLVGSVLGRGIRAEMGTSLKDLHSIHWRSFLLAMLQLLPQISETVALRARLLQTLEEVETNGRPFQGQVRGLLKPLDQGGVDGLLERFGSNGMTAEELLTCSGAVESHFITAGCDPIFAQIVNSLNPMVRKIYSRGFWKYS